MEYDPEVGLFGAKYIDNKNEVVVEQMTIIPFDLESNPLPHIPERIIDELEKISTNRLRFNPQ